MPTNPPKGQASTSRKHLARQQREQRQTRIIVGVAAVVLVLVVAVIAYGIINEKYLRWQRAVVVVNGERISVNQWRAYTKYYRNNLIQQADRAYQLVSMFGGDQNALNTFGGQLVQISQELDAERAGETALNQLVNDTLIRQEAKKRGISVSPEEIEAGVQEAMGYYANGTPTPTPTMPSRATSTLSPTQLALIPPTPTASPTATVGATEAVTATEAVAATPTAEPTLVPTPVITQTATPSPTPTPYTFEAYQQAYATLIANLTTDEITEETIRRVIESRLIQEKLQKEVLGEVDCNDEQVRVQHILVPEEALAFNLLERIKGGEDWATLASKYSTDEGNKDQSGDLGWVSKGDMVPEFEAAAFALSEPGELSEPVQTQFGWHIIRLVAKENRPLSATACTQLADRKFSEWVEGIRADASVDIKDFWRELVPLQPILPSEIQELVNKLSRPQDLPPEFTPPQP